MLHSIVAVCLVGLGLSIKALPPAGEDPAAREDQLRRADCRGGLLIFEAATWLVKETMPFKCGGRKNPGPPLDKHSGNPLDKN